MIQDIEPHKFDIAYHCIKPDMHGANEHQGNKNKSLIFTGDKVLVKRLLNKNDNKSDNKSDNKNYNKDDSKNKDKDINTGLFDFPAYAETKDIISDQHYLFRLDDVYFFRGYVEAESAIDVDKIFRDEAGQSWKYEWQVRHLQHGLRREPRTGGVARDDGVLLELRGGDHGRAEGRVVRLRRAHHLDDVRSGVVRHQVTTTRIAVTRAFRVAIGRNTFHPSDISWS